MTDFQAPGVYVQELRSGPPQIRGISPSTGAMVGRTIGGPANKAIRVDSFAKFQRIFGGFDPNSYLPEAVNHFFLNGGAALYVVRVLGASAGGSANTKASLVLASAAPTTVMTATMIGEGTYGNAYKLLAANEDTILGKIVATDAAAGATTSLVLTAAGVAKVKVGDTLKFADAGTGVTARCIVNQILGNTIKFNSSVTLGSGGLTAAATVVTLETFSLTLFNGASIVQVDKGLRMSSLSQRDYFVTRINTGDDEAQYTIADAGLALGASLDNRPVNTVSGTADNFTLGDEFTTYADSAFIGSTSGPTGLYCLDKYKDVRMVATPGVTGVTAGAVSKAVSDYCANRGDCFAVLETPLAQTVSQAITFAGSNMGSSGYAAMYYPWPQILDPLTGQPAYSPPSGFAMGVMARTDRTRGVQKAPAGELDGKLVGTVGVERILTDDERATLYNANINPVQDVDRVGQCLMGSRTLEIGEFNQISVRRAFIYLETSMKEGSRWVIFEPNDAPTRAKLKRSMEQFLDAEWQKGTLEGAVFSQAYSVVCDATNNPDTIINQGLMIADPKVKLPRTTEFLLIRISQLQSA
jgi:phage tail sheath protein FI